MYDKATPPPQYSTDSDEEEGLDAGDPDKWMPFDSLGYRIFPIFIPKLFSEPDRYFHHHSHSLTISKIINVLIHILNSLLGMPLSVCLRSQWLLLPSRRPLKSMGHSCRTMQECGGNRRSRHSVVRIISNVKSAHFTE